MGSLTNKIAGRRNDQRNWFTYAVISILPVLLVSYVCCHYERAESLLGLFLVEWIVVLVVWRLLCPWLGRQSVVFAAVPFLLSFCVAAILVRESIAEYKAVWNWSDDWWYLGWASYVVDSLRLSGWKFLKSWFELTSIGKGAWTLVGWPYLLGLVSSFVTGDPKLEMLHAIALSLNATFLTLVLALVYQALQKPAQRFPRMVMVCFLLMIGDPIVYAAMCLKESTLQLSLMLAFVFCLKWPERFRLHWLLLGLLGMVGIATMRPAYIPLILIFLYWRVLDKIRLGTFMKLVIGLILFALFGRFILGFQIRGSEIAELMAGRTLEGQAGLAMSVYNIPVIGPLLFYAIAPVPPLPWEFFSVGRLVTTLIRSAGSMAWFLSLCYVLQGVLRGIVRNRSLLKDKLFFSAAIMFAALFVATVLIGSDPRYKQPTNFYLAIMLFLTWYDNRMRRNDLRIQEIGRK